MGKDEVEKLVGSVYKGNWLKNVAASVIAVSIVLTVCIAVARLATRSRTTAWPGSFRCTTSAGCLRDPDSSSSVCFWLSPPVSRWRYAAL